MNVFFLALVVFFSVSTTLARRLPKRVQEISIRSRSLENSVERSSEIWSQESSEKPTRKRSSKSSEKRKGSKRRSSESSESRSIASSEESSESRPIEWSAESSESRSIEWSAESSESRSIEWSAERSSESSRETSPPISKSTRAAIEYSTKTPTDHSTEPSVGISESSPYPSSASSPEPVSEHSAEPVAVSSAAPPEGISESSPYPSSASSPEPVSQHSTEPVAVSSAAPPEGISESSPYPSSVSSPEPVSEHSTEPVAASSAAPSTRTSAPPMISGEISFSSSCGNDYAIFAQDQSDPTSAPQYVTSVSASGVISDDTVKIKQPSAMIYFALEGVMLESKYPTTMPIEGLTKVQFNYAEGSDKVVGFVDITGGYNTGVELITPVPNTIPCESVIFPRQQTCASTELHSTYQIGSPCSMSTYNDVAKVATDNNIYAFGMNAERATQICDPLGSFLVKFC